MITDPTKPLATTHAPIAAVINDAIAERVYVMEISSR